MLEAAWGNVLVVEGDRLTTPPADGRILPGVTRAAVLAGAAAAGLAAREAPLTLRRLADADAILVSSSLVGAVPAALEGGSADAGAFALAAEVARNVRQRTATPVA